MPIWIIAAASSMSPSDSRWAARRSCSSSWRRHADRRKLVQTFVSLGTRGTLARDLETSGCRVVALEQPSGLKPSLILRLARLFHRWGTAVVHTHDTRSLFYAAPAARLTRVPRVVHTCHGRDVRATSRQEAMARHLSRLVDRYVCVSQEVKAQCREQGITGPRVCTILNGIDIDRFPYNGPSPDGPVVTVARLSPEKDVANLVRATAIAARQGTTCESRSRVGARVWKT